MKKPTCKTNAPSTRASDTKRLLPAALGLGFLLNAATALAADDAWSVEVALDAIEPVQSVQIAIDSQGVAGEFRGARGEVACATHPEVGALAAFYRCDSEAKGGCTEPGRLNAALVLDEPVQGHVPLFTCTFESMGQAPDPKAFALDMVETSAMVGEVATQSRASVVIRATRAID